MCRRLICTTQLPVMAADTMRGNCPPKRRLPHTQSEVEPRSGLPRSSDATPMHHQWIPRTQQNVVLHGRWRSVMQLMQSDGEMYTGTGGLCPPCKARNRAVEQWQGEVRVCVCVNNIETMPELNVPVKLLTRLSPFHQYIRSISTSHIIKFASTIVFL